MYQCRAKFFPVVTYQTCGKSPDICPSAFNLKNVMQPDPCLLTLLFRLAQAHRNFRTAMADNCHQRGKNSRCRIIQQEFLDMIIQYGTYQRLAWMV